MFSSVNSHAVDVMSGDVVMCLVSQPPPRRACLVGHQSDMVSLGLVQGCFKMYWGLLRVGFRVGLRFLQGFLIVCFRVYLGLT